MALRCIHGSFLGECMVRGWMKELRQKWRTDDPLVIAEMEGVRVVFAEDERTDWDARLLRANEQWLLLVNKRQGDVRTKFAMAHELAHREIVLNTRRPPEAGDPEVERLCDVGAHELLFGESPPCDI
ncbi:MAG: ImmA/IrrE family metallo-endopeptidase [Candidatus Lernaella stagnicola]|nr:ImmA/IrrE family metallo-endopeptidase [Candidatus Lernaella stagnicola]